MALSEVMSYDRRTGRRRFEERFTAARMARDYVRTYCHLLKKRTTGGEEYRSWLDSIPVTAEPKNKRDARTGDRAFNQEDGYVEGSERQ
jgi:hypothetical protein